MDTPPRVDKTSLLKLLQAAVQADLQGMAQSQRATHEGATHEESRPENDKDTRALESSYLARGLADRVEALQRGASQLEALRLRSFDDDQPIALSAVVVLEDDGALSRYFIAPAGAGEQLELDGQTFLVVTPASPVGRTLIGKQLDDDVDLRTPRGVREWSVLDVY